MPIVDIHPHVIATDNVRYPLQPLGGNQSTWSRDRPTPYEKMIEEMTMPASKNPRWCMRQQLMAMTIPMSPRRSRHILGASPACSPSTCSQPTMSRRSSIGCHAASPACASSPPQHHARPRHLVRRPAHDASMELRRRDRHAGLHAVDATGLPAIARADREISKVSSSSTIWRAPPWSMARRSPRIRSSSGCRAIRMSI